jgi:hypothetical protein
MSCSSCTPDDLKEYPHEETGIWMTSTQQGSAALLSPNYLSPNDADGFFNDFALLAAPQGYTPLKNAWRVVKKPDFQGASEVMLYEISFETFDETGDVPTNWQPNFFRPQVWLNGQDILGLSGKNNNLADLSIGVNIQYCRPGPYFFWNNPSIEVKGEVKRKLDSGLYQNYPVQCTMRFRYKK